MNTSTLEIQKLSDTLLFELTKALGLSQTGLIGKAICPFLEKATTKFAQLGAGLDRVVAESGVAAGARWVLPHFVRDFYAQGLENIPTEGPTVIAANHPAGCDSLVISALVTRPDYKIIIGDIPFFENMPHVSQYAIYAPDPEDAYGRMGVIRACLRHLENGGSLLIFPRGGIEADPAFMPNADDEFDLWSRSLEIFIRRVPQVRVLVAIVSGVIAQSAFRHPITWFRKARPDRQRLAFMLQMLRQTLKGEEIFGLVPRVSFGDAIQAGVQDSRETLETIIASARDVFASHLTWET